MPKTRLTFAAFDSQNLQSGVVSFNRRHKNYELSLQGFEFPEQEGQFYAYLASKDGPDIVEVSGRTENYVRSGYLLDLPPFIKKTRFIGRISFPDCRRILPRPAVLGRKRLMFEKTALSFLWI